MYFDIIINMIPCGRIKLLLNILSSSLLKPVRNRYVIQAAHGINFMYVWEERASSSLRMCGQGPFQCKKRIRIDGRHKQGDAEAQI